MANLFNKLPGFAKTPAGMERKILRLLPRVFLFGSLLVAVPSLSVRLAPVLGFDPVSFKLLSTIDILSIGAMIVFWIALVIIGNGAFVVMVMKGPAYVADAYALIDAETPKNN